MSVEPEVTCATASGSPRTSLVSWLSSSKQSSCSKSKFHGLDGENCLPAGIVDSQLDSELKSREQVLGQQMDTQDMQLKLSGPSIPHPIEIALG